jgi:hypothetical protein
MAITAFARIDHPSLREFTLTVSKYARRCGKKLEDKRKKI